MIIFIRNALLPTEKGIFVSRKPLARRVVRKKPSGDDEERKTPFAKIGVRFGNCTKESKGRSLR